ncbi:MAG: hypothetical protein ACK5HL_01470 [Bacilli bacterium]
MGSETSNIRNQEMTSMLDYGFNQYEKEVLIKKNKSVKSINVDKGNVSTIEAVLEEDLSVIYKKGENKREISYDIKLSDIKVPIKKNKVIGTIDVIENGEIIATKNLVSSKEVKKLNIVNLYMKYVHEIFTGNIKF